MGYAIVCPLHIDCDLFQKRDYLTLLYVVKYNKLLRHRLEIQAAVILLGQDDDTIARMDGAGTPESLTPVNSKEPSPEVSADTSDQINDKKTENLDDTREDSSAREL